MTQSLRLWWSCTAFRNFLTVWVTGFGFPALGLGKVWSPVTKRPTVLHSLHKNEHHSSLKMTRRVPTDVKVWKTTIWSGYFTVVVVVVVAWSDLSALAKGKAAVSLCPGYADRFNMFCEASTILQTASKLSGSLFFSVCSCKGNKSLHVHYLRQFSHVASRRPS